MPRRCQRRVERRAGDESRTLLRLIARSSSLFGQVERSISAPPGRLTSALSTAEARAVSCRRWRSGSTISWSKRLQSTVAEGAQSVLAEAQTLWAARRRIEQRVLGAHTLASASPPMALPARLTVASGER